MAANGVCDGRIDALPPSEECHSGGTEEVLHASHNIGGHELSRLQVFEKNDTRGEAIFQHGNFLKYLRYFVFGPDLPSQVMDAYQDKVVACGLPFTGSDALDVTAFARGLAQSHRLNKQQAPDELYKLALDCGLDPDGARSVRDSVMKVR